MKLNLADNSVRITMLHQSQTYGGMLCGLPNESINESIKNNAVKNANKYLFASESRNIKVTLIEPNMKVGEFTDDFKNIKKQYPVLPGYITTLLLDDFDNHAIVIVFTEDIGNLNEVIPHLEKLNWKKISESYCW